MVLYDAAASEERRSAAAASYNQQHITSMHYTEPKKADRCVYPVIVPDDTLAIIPGVGQDCGLEDRFSKRLVSCPADPDHDHYEVGGSSCGRPDCPRHWSTWGRRAADRVGRILWGYKEASKGRRNPRHTVLSVDDDDPIIKKRAAFSDKANLRYFRKLFTKRALSLGGTGGSVVIHLWRSNEDLIPDWMDERRWDWIRKKGYFWKNFVKFSPHAHIIGYGFYDQPKEGSFDYKNFDPLPDRDAVESVAFYQVSHAPIGVGNAVAYWGCCQPGKLKVFVNASGKKAQGTEEVPVFCKKCNAPMQYADGGGAYFRRRSWAFYEIVGPPPLPG